MDQPQRIVELLALQVEISETFEVVSKAIRQRDIEAARAALDTMQPLMSRLVELDGGNPHVPNMLALIDAMRAAAAPPVIQ